MRAKVILQKARGFALVWAIYLAATTAIALVGIFVVLPLLKFARFGVVEVIPDADYLVKILRAGVICSFVLSGVMWAWAELLPEKDRS